MYFAIFLYLKTVFINWQMENCPHVHIYKKFNQETDTYSLLVPKIEKKETHTNNCHSIVFHSYTNPLLNPKSQSFIAVRQSK